MQQLSNVQVQKHTWRLSVYFLFFGNKLLWITFPKKSNQHSCSRVGSSLCGLAEIWQHVRQHLEQKQTNSVLSHNTNNSPRPQWMQYISRTSDLILHPNIPIVKWLPVFSIFLMCCQNSEIRTRCERAFKLHPVFKTLCRGRAPQLRLLLKWKRSNLSSLHLRC